ncbi:PCL2 [Candida jiufengensis]|uniref:PCL2 n=1 Tax=Candida jiufengensis TaxID=497108 RepID=UPI002224615A|nr:PCL2 [Candida jiufengensis]KAI5951344.1 PCL2 [Candida jiufengensis]
MSDKEALKIFSRQPVSLEMIDFLVSTTNSIIQVKKSPKSSSSIISNTNTTKIISNPIISLTDFIKNLINYSNVQTPTLMSTLYYLNKLRNFLPANAVGMETTRHRIFLSCLIIAAKNLNDSSPLNKHWTKYTNGLLNLYEINLAERELIDILNWNLKINEYELILVLQPFLLPIKQQLINQQQINSFKKLNYYKLSHKNYKNSNNSINSSYSTASSNYSLSSINSSITNNSDYDYQERIPLANKSLNNLPTLSNNSEKIVPIIKKKRSMMNYLNNSRIIN